MLQKWEKEVQVETILHPIPSMNVDGSSTFVAEASSIPMDPVLPSSIPSGIVVTTPSSDHPMLGALVQKKYLLMCAKHLVIAKAHFAHPCQR